VSLRGKFCVAFSLIAVLAMGLAAYGVHALNATSDLIVRLYDQPLMGVNYARAASATLHEARGLMDRGVLLDPDQAFDIARSLGRIETEIIADLRIVRRRVPGEDIASALDRAETSIAAWFHSGRLILDPSLGRSGEPVTALPMRDMVSRQSVAAVAQLDDVVEQVAASGFEFRRRAETELRGSSMALVCLSGGIMAASAAVALLFAHSLISPIRVATQFAEDVAAGRGTEVLPITRRDEIGRLLGSLTTMRTNLLDRDARARVLLRERNIAAETLRQINLRFDAALNRMSRGLMMCDAGGRVVVINRRFCDTYGIDPASVAHDCSWRDVLAIAVAAGNYPGRVFDEILEEHLRTSGSHDCGIVTRPVSGGRMISVSYDPMPDGGWIEIHEDITERRKSEEEIVFLARHDPLTRLPNRILFHERLEQALALAGRGRGFALLCLDLDKFKAVNDTLGHPIGDALLRAVADRLQAVVRDTDTVARLGGDEFAILQLDVSTQAGAQALVHRIFQSVSQPYNLVGHQVTIGVSIGIALVLGGGVTSDELFKNADLALYRAKQEGRGTSRFYEPAMDALAAKRRALEVDLRNAMALGQLALHYQPVVNSRTLMVNGFEALLRWQHPTRGTVPPDEFISVAEEIGIIVPIGAWVLQQACSQAANWPDQIRVAVNLSSLQFRDESLVSTVACAIRNAGIAPERVELEITESVVLQDDQGTLAALHALRALGVRVAMDDFGKGYSSLSYLRSFPFDRIKIDKSFVGDLQTRDEAVAIIRAITGLAEVLHMDTTAEGVETREQLEILTAAGCTALQGYLFSKPVAPALLPALIKRLSPPECPVLTVFAGAADLVD
jgi:diguanylate cyclase (GGDEF)-like protein